MNWQVKLSAEASVFFPEFFQLSFVLTQLFLAHGAGQGFVGLGGETLRMEAVGDFPFQHQDILINDVKVVAQADDTVQSKQKSPFTAYEFSYRYHYRKYRKGLLITILLSGFGWH